MGQSFSPNQLGPDFPAQSGNPSCRGCQIGWEICPNLATLPMLFNLHFQPVLWSDQLHGTLSPLSSPLSLLSPLSSPLLSSLLSGFALWSEEPLFIVSYWRGRGYRYLLMTPSSKGCSVHMDAPSGVLKEATGVQCVSSRQCGPDYITSYSIDSIGKTHKWFPPSPPSPQWVFVGR